jgi:hypothetical protein
MLLSLILIVGAVYIGYEFGQALRDVVGPSWAVIILVPIWLLTLKFKRG